MTQSNSQAPERNDFTGTEDEPIPPRSPYLAQFGINAGWIEEEIEDQYRVDASSVDSSWADALGEVLGETPARRAPSPTASASTPTPSAPPTPTRSAPAAPRAVAPSDGSSADATGPLAPIAAVTRIEELGESGGGVTNGALRTLVDGSEPAPAASTDHATLLHIADKQARVLRMIHSYRARGHRIAQSDPLGGQSTYFPELDPAHYGFGNENLDEPFIAGDLPGGSVQTLRQILTRLGKTYCGPIGVEFTHVQDPGRKAWLREIMEEGQNHPNLDDGERRRILEKLVAAEFFESFLHTKFLGQKRFSLEGGESLIPLLDHIVENAPSFGIREVVFGMAHRGRLNVLRQHPRQELRGDLLGVRGLARRRRALRLGRRQVPQGILDGSPRRERRARPPDAHLEPVASRGGRSRRRGAHEGEAGARRGRRRRDDRAGDRARRRRLRGSGHRRRDAEPLAARRLLHGWHDPRDREQPDRLHDDARRGALDALLHRCREDDPGADLPRERRPSRGGDPRDEGRDGLSPALSATTS